MNRLSLKDKPFQTFEPAASVEIDSLWANCLKVDANLDREDLTKIGTKDASDFHAFVKSHCKATHYSFQIKKCRDDVCTICKPLRDSNCINMPFLPDPEL